MKKRKILACAVLIASLSMGAYGTIAYFTADTTVTNVITSGNIDIALRQTSIPENGGTPEPVTEVTGVMPGRIISQIVQVENTGTHDAYIRVTLGKEIIFASESDAMERGLEPDLSLVTYDINTEDWTEKDGYYYYNNVLKAGELTTPLITYVEFDKTMGNEYQDSKAKLNVTAYATQVEHNGANVMEAKGWPAEE